MRKLLPLALALALLAPLPAAATPTAAATDVAKSEARTPTHIRLGGVRVRLHHRNRQVVTVNHTRGYHARVILWRRTPHGWRKRMEAADGRIGYGGLVLGRRRHQGTGTTPIGTYRLPWAFGTHRRNAAWGIGYRRTRPGDYWVEDNGSRFYNRYRNRHRGGFRWWLPASDPNSSERLRDYPTQYEWSIVTGFNHRQVRHRGAGIFLHVNGSGATAGCVSAPRWFIRSLMRRLDSTHRPVIAIGR